MGEHRNKQEDYIVEKIVTPEGKVVERKITRAEWRGFLFTYTLVWFGLMLGQLDGSMFSFVIPQLTKAFNLTVADIGFIVSGGWVLGGIGSLWLGMLSDRIGRKPLYNLTVFLAGVFSGLTAFVGNVLELIAVRLFTGIGTWMEWTPAATITSEESLIRWRSVFIAILNLTYPLGFMLASGFAYLIVPSFGWRPLFYIAFAPLIVVGLMWFRAKETKRFTDLKNQLEGKSGIFRADLEKAKQIGIKQLFSKDLRNTTLWVTVVSMSAFFVNYAQYYGIVYLTSAGAGGLPYATALLVSFAAFGVYTLGYVMSGFIVRRIGYKRNATYSLLAAIPMTIITALYAHGVWEWVVWPLYLLAIVGAWWPSYLNIVSTAFPTRARGTALGYSLLLGGLSTAAWISFAGYMIGVIGVNYTYLIGLAPIIVTLLAFLKLKEIPVTASLEEIAH